MSTLKVLKIKLNRRREYRAPDLALVLLGKASKGQL